MSIRAIASAALRDHGGDVEKAIPAFIQAARKANKVTDLARIYLRMVATQGIADAAPNLTPRMAAALTRPTNVTPINQVQRRQTEGERLAARQAMRNSADAIYEMRFDGRALGRIKIGELITLRDEYVADAAKFLELGTEFVRNAALAGLILKHAGTVDQFAEVRDVLSGKKLTGLREQADKNTPTIMEKLIRQATATAVKEIAS